ncbi:hypothetical protein CRG98_034317 [Punica granatum]|uniref:Uncharacterized protein n=1 Tax=Punica granatum TaxID=22663 RepID=A0A2I0IMQ1_PUNGR|nr:hypothetical protein CRG98_034317 [Punica granatum]
MEATDSIGVLDRPDWHPRKNKSVRVISTDFLAGSLRFWSAKGPSYVVVVVIWFQWFRFESYSPTKIKQNRARPRTDPTEQVSGRTSPWLNISMEEEASCMEEEAKEEGRQSRVTTALGQAMCPTGLEGSSGRSLFVENKPRRIEKLHMKP